MFFPKKPLLVLKIIIYLTMMNQKHFSELSALTHRMEEFSK